MKEVVSTSSSPATDERLLRVPLELLHPHPLNVNQMSAERLEKLQRNIEREGRYPPLIVRPHPETPDAYQLLDGHQRLQVLERCGDQTALCYVWDCDDETALLLLATLNRLEGEDLPARRAELLRELTALLPAEELALLLPEDAALINDLLAMFSLDAAELLDEFTRASERQERVAPRLVSFALSPDDEADVEAAVKRAGEELDGTNRRGRALGIIARRYLEDASQEAVTND